MSVSIELLEALKASQGGISDYKAAKIIGVRQQTFSQYRNNSCALSAEKVLLICKLAGLDEIEWLLKMYKERAKSTGEADAIESIQHRLAA